MATTPRYRDRGSSSPPVSRDSRRVQDDTWLPSDDSREIKMPRGVSLQSPDKQPRGEINEHVGTNHRLASLRLRELPVKSIAGGLMGGLMLSPHRFKPNAEWAKRQKAAMDSFDVDRERHRFLMGDFAAVNVGRDEFEKARAAVDDKSISVEIRGPATLLQSCLDHGADLFHKPLTTLLSPLYPLSLPIDDLEAMRVPLQARFYAFFYPCASINAECGPHKAHILAQESATHALLVYGGFCYCDCDGVRDSLSKRPLAPCCRLSIPLTTQLRGCACRSSCSHSTRSTRSKRTRT